MGLDVSHDAWRGAYSAFHRFRVRLAEVAGLPPLEEMQGFTANGKPWTDCPPALKVLLHHSDCDGEIEVKDLIPLAEELERLAPLMGEDGDGHIGRGGGFAGCALRFAKGCREAAAAGEPLEFC